MLERLYGPRLGVAWCVSSLSGALRGAATGRFVLSELCASLSRREERLRRLRRRPCFLDGVRRDKDQGRGFIVVFLSHETLPFDAM